jgi:hypothetical protein
MRIKLLVFITILSFFVLTIYAEGRIDNTDVISDYNKNLIQTGYFKPINLLQTIDREKYNLIIFYLGDNENIEDYYFNITICIKMDDNTEKIIDDFIPDKSVPDESNQVKNLPENENNEINYGEVIYIDYNIYFYEIFFNKYIGYRGDPTGKCFTIRYNIKDEFIGYFGMR